MLQQVRLPFLEDVLPRCADGCADDGGVVLGMEAPHVVLGIRLTIGLLSNSRTTLEPDCGPVAAWVALPLSSLLFLHFPYVFCCYVLYLETDCETGLLRLTAGCAYWGPVFACFNVLFFKPFGSLGAGPFKQ